MSRRVVVPPPPPELRALRRATLAAVALTLLALGSTLALSGVLPGGALGSRLEAMEALGAVRFRVLWMLWVPASLSFLVFLNAWARAVRPGGLAASALPLGTVAVTLDVLGEVFYAWALPGALVAGAPWQVTVVDRVMWVLVAVPANGLYAAAFALLAARSWRAGRLPRGLLLGLAPFLALAVVTLLAALTGRDGWLGTLAGPWFLAVIAWWLALARWTTTVGVRAK